MLRDEWNYEGVVISDWGGVHGTKAAEQVIFIGGLNHEHDCEGNDRADMKLPYEQDRLIEELLGVNPGTVIVMVGGSPVEMGSWSGLADSLLWTRPVLHVLRI